MRLKLLTAAALFALGASVALADEKPVTPGGPPPGKGKNKFVAPAPPASVKPEKYGKLDPKAAPKAPAPAAKPPAPPDDGIGKYVSAWARSGIHGRQLAAMIHQLQAARASAPKGTPAPAPKKPGKSGYQPPPQPPLPPTPPGNPGKGKGKGGEE